MILVDAMKSHQGIQRQQSGPKPADRLPEPRAVPTVIEPEHWGGDHVNLHPFEIQTTMPGIGSGDTIPN